MPWFRRDPEKALEQSHAKMVKQLAEKGDTLARKLQNELADAMTTRPLPASTQAAYKVAGDRWVAEEAMRLESSRPHGRNRRSADADMQGFAPTGIFAARHPNASGQIPYERWPEHTVAHVEQPQYQERPYMPPPGQGRGCGCGYC